MSIMYPFQLLAMMQNERKPLDSLKKMQNLRLSNLIRHAYENVPYYRNLFERENITPDDIKSIDDLVKIPVSTKADFTQVEPDDLIAKNYINAPLVKKRTSGSTGMPFVFAFSREDNIIKDLMLARIFLTNGFNIFKKRVHIMDPQSMTSENASASIRLTSIPTTRNKLEVGSFMSSRLYFEISL